MRTVFSESRLRQNGRPFNGANHLDSLAGHCSRGAQILIIHFHLDSNGTDFDYLLGRLNRYGEQVSLPVPHHDFSVVVPLCSR
jgi:hypothetical protein